MSLKKLFIYGPQGVGKSVLRRQMLNDGYELPIYTGNEEPKLGSTYYCSEDETGGRRAWPTPQAGDRVWQMLGGGRIIQRRTL